MQTAQQPKRFKQTAETALLIAYLAPIASAKDCRTVLYSELSQAAHCDVQTKGRGYLYRAIERIEKDHGRLFICPDHLRGVGVKLATEAERSELAEKHRRHVQRGTRRTLQRTIPTKLDELTNQQRLAHMANHAILGLLEQSTRAIVHKRLEASYAKTGPKNMEAEELMRVAGVKQIE